jgi:hypothetical protein
MIDPSRILDSLFEGLGPDEGSDFPLLPTQLPTVGVSQHTDITAISHTSRTSHTANEQPEKTSSISSSVRVVPAGVSRVTSSCAESVGSVGSVGSDPNPPLQEGSFLFPLSSEKVGSVGRGPAAAGRSVPLSPTDVRAGVARELRALADLGRAGPDALRDAVEITAAKIRNSAALAESQWNGSRCHVCDDSLNDDRVVVAVMQGHPGKPLHMHAGCHAEHKARRTAIVDGIMTAAGYGAGTTDGEVA